MVKRTNRIQNLNKMIQDYKLEQQKFEIIEQEIFNQQKEIEDLRLLILSTNFLNHSNSIKKSNQSDTSTEINSKLDSSSFKERQSNGKQTMKNLIIKNSIKDKMNLKIKDLQDKSVDQLKSSKNDEINLNDKDLNCDLINKKNENKQTKFNQTPNQSIKPKGLKTISKNVLNQQVEKCLQIENDRSSSKLLNDLKIKSELMKNCENLIKSDESKMSNNCKSIELLNKLNKLKPMINKFENQENPKDRFGLNKISKSIKKVTRSSTLKSSSKLANSNHQLNQLTLQRL